jgi:hypothetical protein
MKTSLLSFSISVCFICSSLQAQISPGGLSRAHENLEGVNNCTRCHEQGEEITGKKCLECHIEIRDAIAGKHGLHFQNAGSTCITCHKEHLGRNASITQFDKTHFDHRKTGYPLAGKHGSLACESCHSQNKIKDPAVFKNIKSYPHQTFLGLQKQCSECHPDRHSNTLGMQCQNCHTEDGWKRTSGFSHAKTKFPLVGKHEIVSCVKCHASLQISEPAKSILFSIALYDDCNSCHQSPHGKKFSDQSCKSCHSPAGWQSIAGFDHAKTAFTLEGKHKTIACEKCHTDLKGVGEKKSFITKSFKDCTPCHRSPHTETFSRKSCSSCHSPQRWSFVPENTFDHNLTIFPLRGKHSFLKCSACHKAEGTRTFKEKFSLGKKTCSSCHEDIHKDEFLQKYANDCSRCHTEEGFGPSTFTFELHRMTTFELTHAHLTVPCKNCHGKGGRLQFHFKNLNCELCHSDPHKAKFSAFLKRTSCEVCHSTVSWNDMQFDHKVTSFLLLGQHASVKCMRCHEKTFKGTSRDCADCHSDPHAGQFLDKGRTDCSFCHTPVSRRALIFRHNIQSTFPLTGTHATVECGACHKPEKLNGRLVVRYKPLSSKCESCHQGGRL